MIKKYIGRDYDTFNCFDLVKAFYLEHFGLDLMNYFEGDKVPGRAEIESLIISSKGNFIKVDKPEYGDIVVINLYGYSCHMGIYLGKDKLLHSIRGTGSCLDSISRYSKIIDGFYRHRETRSA